VSPLGHSCHMYLLLCLRSAIEHAEVEAEHSPQNEHAVLPVHTGCFISKNGTQLFWSRQWVILSLCASYALPGTQRAVLDYCISMGSWAGGLQQLSCVHASCRRRKRAGGHLPQCVLDGAHARGPLLRPCQVPSPFHPSKARHSPSRCTQCFVSQSAEELSTLMSDILPLHPFRAPCFFCSWVIQQLK
jgi:hypothetical protein